MCHDSHFEYQVKRYQEKTAMEIPFKLHLCQMETGFQTVMQEHFSHAHFSIKCNMELFSVSLERTTELLPCC